MNEIRRVLRENHTRTYILYACELAKLLTGKETPAQLVVNAQGDLEVTVAALREQDGVLLDYDELEEVLTWAQGGVYESIFPNNPRTEALALLEKFRRHIEEMRREL